MLKLYKKSIMAIIYGPTHKITSVCGPFCAYNCNACLLAMRAQISSLSIYKRALLRYQASIARQAFHILNYCAHELVPKSCWSVSSPKSGYYWLVLHNNSARTIPYLPFSNYERSMWPNSTCELASQIMCSNAPTHRLFPNMMPCITTLYIIWPS
jgi:hypothetical protein